MKTPPQQSENGPLPPVTKSRGCEADLRELQIHEPISDRTHQRKRKGASWDSSVSDKTS